jgi:hypothetical protein
MNFRRWEEALAQHQEALDRCIAAARRVPDEKWSTPRSDGKWSPAQQLIHVGLAYQMVYDDLQGNPPKPRLSRTWQFISRTFFLPFVIGYDWFRDGVPAPREIRPPADVIDRDAVDAQVRERARNCVEAMLAAPKGACVSHPYFGSITLLKMLKVGTSHTRHHTRIIMAATSSKT